MENGKNNGENSGPLTSLQVDRLTATDCNAAARAKKKLNIIVKLSWLYYYLVYSLLYG